VYFMPMYLWYINKPFKNTQILLNLLNPNRKKGICFHFFFLLISSCFLHYIFLATDLDLFLVPGSLELDLMPS
jgi:hypothetical protein